MTGEIEAKKKEKEEQAKREMYAMLHTVPFSLPHNTSQPN